MFDLLNKNFQYYNYVQKTNNCNEIILSKVISVNNRNYKNNQIEMRVNFTKKNRLPTHIKIQ